MDLLLSDWVFGYGSLIWNPEIDFDRSEIARAHGYHRAFCISSTRYRGTRAAPGVVLGLDRGGSCVGVAMHLHHPRRRDSIARLYEREMLNRVYTPTLVALTLRSGAQIRALSFVANRASPDYQQLTEAFGGILEDFVASIVDSGYSREYEMEADAAAVELLRSSGYDPRALVSVLRKLQARQASSGGDLFSTHPAVGDRIDLIAPLTGDGAAETVSARQERFEAATARARSPQG